MYWEREERRLLERNGFVEVLLLERDAIFVVCVLQEEHGKSLLLEQQRSGDLEDQLRQQSVVSQISYVTVDNTCIQWELL